MWLRRFSTVEVAFVAIGSRLFKTDVLSVSPGALWFCGLLCWIILNPFYHLIPFGMEPLEPCWTMLNHFSMLKLQRRDVSEIDPGARREGQWIMFRAFRAPSAAECTYGDRMGSWRQALLKRWLPESPSLWLGYQDKIFMWFHCDFTVIIPMWNLEPIWCIIGFKKHCVTVLWQVLKQSLWFGQCWLHGHTWSTLLRVS